MQSKILHYMHAVYMLCIKSVHVCYCRIPVELEKCNWILHIHASAQDRMFTSAPCIVGYKKPIINARQDSHTPRGPKKACLFQKNLRRSVHWSFHWCALFLVFFYVHTQKMTDHWSALQWSVINVSLFACVWIPLIMWKTKRPIYWRPVIFLMNNSPNLRFA